MLRDFGLRAKQLRVSSSFTQIRFVSGLWTTDCVVCRDVETRFLYDPPLTNICKVTF